MKLFGDRKLVSRERVVGLSLADILLQAVFLLFIALIIGYEDPIILLQIKEYAQVGKDLCNKKHKDTLTECKEQIVKDENNANHDIFADVGNKLCKAKYKDPKICIEDYLAAMKLKAGNLAACIPKKGESQISTDAEPSVEFRIMGANEIRFERFTVQYLKYLQSNNDQTRLIKANSIKEKQTYLLKDIESEFAFMRQSECFHQPRVLDSDNDFSRKDLYNATNVILRTVKSLSK